jgi:hypothetical protein
MALTGFTGNRFEGGRDFLRGFFEQSFAPLSLPPLIFLKLFFPK